PYTTLFRSKRVLRTAALATQLRLQRKCLLHDNGLPLNVNPVEETPTLDLEQRRAAVHQIRRVTPRRRPFEPLRDLPHSHAHARAHHGRNRGHEPFIDLDRESQGGRLRTGRAGASGILMVASDKFAFGQTCRIVTHPRPSSWAVVAVARSR